MTTNVVVTPFWIVPITLAGGFVGYVPFKTEDMANTYYSMLPDSHKNEIPRFVRIEEYEE